MKICVLNIRRDKVPSDSIYIGRKSSTNHHYGNIASHLDNTLASIKVANRNDAIKAYQDWLDGVKYQDVEPDRRLWILAQIKRLAERGENISLSCFCRPYRCHGDVIRERILAINAKIYGDENQ